MRHRYALMVAVLIIAGLQLSACQRQSAKEKAEPPATIERIEGTGLSRVTLSEKAVQRLGLETDQVREERAIRQRTVGGEIIALPATQVGDRRRVIVRVRLPEGDLRNVVRGQPARVLLRDRDDDGFAAEEADDVEDEDMDEEVDEDREKDKPAVGDRRRGKAARLYYAVTRPGQGLVPGQRVRVRLPLAGSGTKRKVVPYSALIYDKVGQTWVYTSPSPRTFVRHKVEVDYIQGNIAVLTDGPPTGTVVASVGVAELYGADTGIGK